MTESINWINSNIWNIITLLGFLVGIIGILLFLKGRKSKKPVYFLRTFDIVKKDEDIPKLKLTYEDHPIETLSITRIAILNNGNETIRSEDVAKSDPLRIEISKNFKILDANFHYTNEKNPNAFSLETIENQNIIKINFDYIGEGEGGIIQIIHDGAASEDISIEGSFKFSPGKFVQMSAERDIREKIILVAPPLLITFFTLLFLVNNIMAGMPLNLIEIILDYGYSPSWAAYISMGITLILMLFSAILCFIVFYLCLYLNVKSLKKFSKNHIEFYESKM